MARASGPNVYSPSFPLTMDQHHQCNAFTKQQLPGHIHPMHPNHSSAFHQVASPGHLHEGHGSSPDGNCPYLHYMQRSQDQIHHPVHAPPHPPGVAGNAFCPAFPVEPTTSVQHHPIAAAPAPVIIDSNQMPDQVRTIPITSLPSAPLLVPSLPVAAATFVQPLSPPEFGMDSGNRNSGLSTHHHHHYHHHHHHHHHFAQPPYPVPQAQQPLPSYQPSHMHHRHHRHYRRWQHIGAPQTWQPSVYPTVHASRPPIQPNIQPNIQPYPNFLYHLLSVMSIPPQPPTQAWDESFPQENYESFLNLAEQIGEVKPKGLSRAEIDQLPTYRVTKESKEEDDDNRCVICLVDFEEKQLVRVLPCLHEYHTRCVDKWLKSNRTCPICRSEVNVTME